MTMEDAPYPTSFTCIDAIVYVKEENSIVMIKKFAGDLLRLPGGFVDPTDLSLIHAVRRELNEEIGLLRYGNHYKNVKEHGSFLTQDKGRYELGVSKHRLRTFLFSGEITSDKANRLVPGDDAFEIGALNVDLLNDIGWITSNVVPGHIPLLYTWFATLEK